MKIPPSDMTLKKRHRTALSVGKLLSWIFQPLRIGIFFWKLAGNLFRQQTNKQIHKQIKVRWWPIFQYNIQLPIFSSYKKRARTSCFQEKFLTSCNTCIGLGKISFSSVIPYLPKPYAKFYKTNVVNLQTHLMWMLVAGFRPFFLLSDPLISRMDFNFRAGD